MFWHMTFVFCIFPSLTEWNPRDQTLASIVYEHFCKKKKKKKKKCIILKKKKKASRRLPQNETLTYIRTREECALCGSVVFFKFVSFGALSKCQITQCCNFYLVKQRGSLDGHCIMQTCPVGHVDSDGVLHTRTIVQWAVSLWGKNCPFDGERGEQPQEENEWDAYHRRTRRRLFQIPYCSGAIPRTNSLLSLMCIPLCAFLYTPF